MAEDHKNENAELRSFWEEPVEEEYSFDALARGLASGTISRGRALKLVGAAILSGALITLWSGEAQAASFRRRCHRRGAPYAVGAMATGDAVRAGRPA